MHKLTFEEVSKISNNKLSNNKDFLLKQLKNKNVDQLKKNYLEYAKKLNLISVVTFLKLKDTYEVLMPFDNIGQELLLHDLMGNNKIDDKLEGKWESLIKRYFAVINETISKSLECRNDILFLKRIPRLEKYLRSEKKEIKEILTINNKKAEKTIKTILLETKEYFLTEKIKVSAITQGDFHEMNISLKPVIYDIDLLGENDILGEFAVFIWGTLIQEPHLLRKYKINHFNESKLLKDKSCFTQIKYNNKKIEVNYKITHNKSRNKILNIYLEGIKKIIKEKNEINWKYLKYYMILRIFCVDNILEYEELDFMLCLALANELYSFQTIEEYINFIDNLSQT
jgi:hypothetical protein